MFCLLKLKLKLDFWLLGILKDMDTVCSLQIRYNGEWVESDTVKVLEGQVETMEMKTG